MDMDVTLSKSGTELDSSFSTASSTSIHQLSDESVRCQEKLDRIFGSSIPYVLEIGDICFDEDDVFDKQDEHKKKEKKSRKNRINLVEDPKDDEKINYDNNNQHIIPIERYAKPFKEEFKLADFKSFRLAPIQLHHKGFKEDSIEWLRTRKKGGCRFLYKINEIIISQLRSCGGTMPTF
jgi:hypothetical protein